jgi:hypothetical protein
MKSAVGVHGTMLSNIVPVSSSERDKTFLLIPSSSNFDLKASPTIKVVAYWFEVMALVKTVAPNPRRKIIGVREDLKDACLLFIKDLLLASFFLTAPDLLKLSDFHFASHSRKGGGIGVV